MKKLLMLSVSSTSLAVLLPAKALAHCPLCVGGAGAAAAVATLLGVKYGAIGVFMGGFAVALGLWIPRLLKKHYFKYQHIVLFWVIYLSTLLPMYPFLKGDYVSKFVSVSGEYGSWLNTTYLIDLFIVGAGLGSFIVYVSPKISARISKKRGRTVKFQGLIITFTLLILAAVMLQVWPRW